MSNSIRCEVMDSEVSTFVSDPMGFFDYHWWNRGGNASVNSKARRGFHVQISSDCWSSRTSPFSSILIRDGSVTSLIVSKNDLSKVFPLEERGSQEGVDNDGLMSINLIMKNRLTSDAKPQIHHHFLYLMCPCLYLVLMLSPKLS